ncbi:hypothetical protein NEF87_003830 [Candidatus Lokiarchaeum ossiferum]|uniref:Uncharacterized protein n=1 Tax=Candidatus Lokiarchaeum ossiferum TaxID=2951803 RepID=A0ABY6HVJ6_9ARCH|nr:hypothetical protein NEF87_003830 [Candidatus Lokiarchaeum sp. B-35]
MVDSIVARTLTMDFIYLDLLFISIWVIYLIKKRYWMPLIWGFVGWLVYIFVDYYLWYRVMGVRTYEGPINDVLFFLWFCFSPGFVQFSYVFTMFEKRNRKDIILITLIFYVGWTLIGLGSQLLPKDDRIVRVARNMNEAAQRISFTALVLFNICIAFLLVWKKRLSWQDVGYLFLVGTLVEFCLEFSLAISGIRLEQGTWSPILMIVNTLIEFNMGIVLMYLIWGGFKWVRDRNVGRPLQYQDFKYIKTDFNVISRLGSENLPKISPKMANRVVKLYNKQEVIFDLRYYFKKYSITDRKIEDAIKLVEQIYSRSISQVLLSS